MGKARRVGMETFKVNMTKIVNQVRDTKEPVVLTRQGRAVVLIVPLGTIHISEDSE